MGAPTKTQFESFSDQIAADIAAGMAGFRSEYNGKTVKSYYDLVDASGDPFVEDALIGPAIAMDEKSLPLLAYNWLPRIYNRPEIQAMIRALRTLVTSPDGGAYSSFRAYVVDKSVKVHPLYGEAHNFLYPGDFISSQVVAGFGNPTYGAVNASRVYRGADGSLAEETADAASTSTADVTLTPTNGHSVYVGSDRPFSAVSFGFSTLGSDNITATIKYWNGSTWATLTCTDGTTGFTKNGVITFTPPSDWTRTYQDLGGTDFPNDKNRLYYLRINRTNATGVTPAVASLIQLVPTYAPLAASSSKHLGIAQPPLALFQITGVDTVTVTIPASIDYTRFAAPLGSENKLRLRALTPITDDVTLTLAYKDGTGTGAGATKSQAQSAWSTIAAGGTKTIALAGSDALKSVLNTSTVVTAAVEGAFVLEAVEIRTPAV